MRDAALADCENSDDGKIQKRVRLELSYLIGLSMGLSILWRFVVIPVSLLLTALSRCASRRCKLWAFMTLQNEDFKPN